MYDMCPKNYNIFHVNNNHLSRTTKKNTKEQQYLCLQRTLQNPDEVFIVYLTKLLLYLIGHSQPKIPVTHLPNVGLMSQ